MYRRTLYKASMEGDWDKAKHVFNSNPNAWRTPLNTTKCTSLILATIAGQTKFMEELVQLMPPEDLLQQDTGGFTALHSVATRGDAKAAEILVRKNPALTHIRNVSGETPLLRAAFFGHKDLLVYLCAVTREQGTSPFEGKEGATLLDATIQANLYDVALSLVQLHPQMATTRARNGNLAIRGLAHKSWPSMDQTWVSFWQRGIITLLGKSDGLFANAVKQLVPRVKSLYDAEIMHRQYMELVDYLCNRVKDNVWIVQWSIGQTILVAANHGNLDFIKSIINNDPTQMWWHKNDQRMLQIAIECRQEKVFNYIKQFRLKDGMARRKDYDSGEMTLLLAAKMAPDSKLKAVSGPALQMQRELQWYKEVENLVYPQNREGKNSKRECAKAFTEQHADLVKEGEIWMKSMAQSSIVLATFMATVVFAAAFIVPGGNVSDVGFPIFLHTKSYMVFAVSNALAFFSFLTSVLIFLLILTARCAEEDFLRSLPQKLIIGHATLLFAIATMTIAFSATYFLMLGPQLAWVSILIALSLVFLQHYLVSYIFHFLWK